MKTEGTSVETVVAEIEISYKPLIKPSLRPKLSSPEDAYRLLIDSWDMEKIELVEQFKVMLLNRAKRVLGICSLTTGSATGTIADPRLVFAIALKANASEIIIAHNHPSGNLMPSTADEKLTLKMKAAGELLDIPVIDHVIVSIEGFYSFAKEGLL